MKKNNRLRLTWVSFLSYGLTGALFIITGVVLGNIADYFHVPISSMSNTFTFLNSGILAAIFLNAWLMELISLKRQLIFGFMLMILVILGLICGHNLKIFSILMFVLGLVSGITMSIGTYLITNLYQGWQRGSCLLFADSFFSMAGTIFPILAGIMLSHHVNWYWIYACISILYVIICILTLMSDFPSLCKKGTETTVVMPLVKEKWCISVMILAVSALCYILGQLGFIYWIPEYVTQRFKMNIQQAGWLVSNFWTAYMVGMWVFSTILRFIDLQHIVTLLAAVSAIFMYLFISTENPAYLPYYLLGLGFFSSAIYATIITLGSQQTSITSPKVVNFILTSGTIGTMLTFIVTSPIVTHYGVTAALHTSNVLYVVVFILCLLLGFFSRHRIHNKI